MSRIRLLRVSASFQIFALRCCYIPRGLPQRNFLNGGGRNIRGRNVTGGYQFKRVVNRLCGYRQTSFKLRAGVVWTTRTDRLRDLVYGTYEPGAAAGRLAVELADGRPR